MKIKFKELSKDHKISVISALMIMLGGIIIVALNFFNGFMLDGYINNDYKPHLFIIGFMAGLGGMTYLKVIEIDIKLERLNKQNG